MFAIYVSACSSDGSVALEDEVCASEASLVWEHVRPADSALDYVAALTLDVDGVMLEGGRAGSIGVLRKHTLEGDLLWEGRAGSATVVADLAVDGDGSTYAVGIASNVEPGSGDDIWFARFGSDGSLSTEGFHVGSGEPHDLWGSDFANGVALRSDGSFVMVGREDDELGFLPFIQAVSAEGEPLWRAGHGGSSATAVVTSAADHAYVVGGDTEGPWLAALDPNGQELWSVTEPLGLQGGFSDVALSPTEQVFVVGHDGGRAWIGAYTTSGESLWTSLYSHGAGGETWAESVAVLEDDRIVVGGHRFGADTSEGWVEFLTVQGDPAAPPKGHLLEWSEEIVTRIVSRGPTLITASVGLDGGVATHTALRRIDLDPCLAEPEEER